MSRLKLIQHAECPPDQYRYKHREDGWLDKCYDYTGWLRRIEDHRRINGYHPPEDWIAEAEDQLCKLLPPGWCQQDTGAPPAWFLDARVGIDDVLRGTKVLGAFVLQGAPVVQRTVAAARGAICATCPFATKVGGCGSCAGISNAIAEVASEPLPSDTLLENKSCLVCKCAARAQIWMPIHLLNMGVTEEMMGQFPDWCWKRAEIEEYRKQN